MLTIEYRLDIDIQPVICLIGLDVFFCAAQLFVANCVVCSLAFIPSLHNFFTIMVVENQRFC